MKFEVFEQDLFSFIYFLRNSRKPIYPIQEWVKNWSPWEFFSPESKFLPENNPGIRRMTETEYQDLDPHNPTTEQKNQVADLIRELAENLAVKQDEGI